MSAQDNEKVLLLSLGAGRLDEKGSGYRPAKYRYQENDVDSEFVAEPLLNSFQPDTLVIIGTAKSKWDMFFGWFAKKSGDMHLSTNAITETLKSCENRENSIPEEELNTLSDQLSADLAPLLKTDCFRTVKRICAVVVRYGIDDRELEENYSILSDRLGRVFTEPKQYDVAFDITHSFRSMPMYNLIVLNYLSSVFPYELNICHVYYGMLDVIREMGYAPVTDLSRLMDTLRLAQAVEEFRHTGSVLTITRLLTDDEDSELRTALQDLSWAMECNSMSGFDRSMKILLEKLQVPVASRKPYADIRVMLKQVLSDCFGLDAADPAGSWEQVAQGDMLPAQKQILLAKWYLRLNLCGKAALVAQEALRTVLYPLWMEVNTSDNGDEEARRRNAMSALQRVADVLRKEKTHSEAEEILLALEDCHLETLSLRIGYAHNLDFILELDDSRKKTQQMIEKLERAVDTMELPEKRELLLAAYRTKPEPPVRINIGNRRPSRLILFGKDSNIQEVCREKSKAVSSKPRYDVYYLSGGFTAMLCRSKDVNQCTALLTEAFRTAGLDISSFSDIFLWKLKTGEGMRIAAALGRLNCEKVSIMPSKPGEQYCFSPAKSFLSESESSETTPAAVIPNNWIVKYRL